MPGAFAAATHSMMRALALDMKPVRVNLVSPGAVETELWDGMLEGTLEGLKARAKESTTTGELGRPGDVAEAYLYFMRDRNVSATMIGSNSGALIVG